MTHKLRAAIVSIALSFFASTSLLAQQMTIDPATKLPAGGKAKVLYSDPSAAGQEVLILVTGDDGTTTQVIIKLDAQGNGSGSVDVSATWRSAQFQGPSVAPQTLPVG